MRIAIQKILDLGMAVFDALEFANPQRHNFVRTYCEMDDESLDRRAWTGGRSVIISSGGKLLRRKSRVWKHSCAASGEGSEPNEYRHDP